MSEFERSSYRAVYISGQLGSRHSANAVGRVLEEQACEVVGNNLATDGYEVVDTFRFSGLIWNLPKAIRAMKGADVYTHSAGSIIATDAVLLEGEDSDAPTALHLIAPPTPKTIRELLRGAAEKTFSPGDTGDPDEEIASGVLHVIPEALLHPFGNFVPLVSGRIGNYNACSEAGDARRKYGGMGVNLAFMDNDGFGFAPSATQAAYGRANGARIVELHGVHDQLPMYPRTTLEQYRDALSAA